jgi:tRNA A58 N-methylase Trm61
MPRPKKVSPEALSVLSNLEYCGSLVKIKDKLARPLYTEVNEVLEALGGKWNRKQQGHTFAGDPHAAVDQIIVDGEFSDEKRDFEFFATPDAVGDVVVKKADLQPDDLVLEPSCGDGTLMQAILRNRPDVRLHACEIRESSAFKAKERFTLLGS